MSAGGSPTMVYLPPTIYLSFFYVRLNKRNSMTIVQQPPLGNAQFIPGHFGGGLAVRAHHSYSILPSVLFIVPAHPISLFDNYRMGIAHYRGNLARTF